MTRVQIRTALAETTLDDFYCLPGRWPFVEVDERRWGLVGRDVPGGCAAFERAVRVLTGGRLTSGEALTRLQSLGDEFTEWTPEMAASAYRAMKLFGGVPREVRE